MKQRHILVSDDDPGVLDVIRIRLEAGGFTVTTAQDSYQALSLARSTKPDVMVLDINMPAGSGFSVQERIAEIPEIAQTPIIFITGEVGEKVDRDAMRRGAAAIVERKARNCGKSVSAVSSKQVGGPSRARTFSNF